MRDKLRDALVILAIIAALGCFLIFFTDTHFTVAREHDPAFTVSGNGVIVENDRALVDINTADKEMLCTLPDIGEKTAEAIIADRQENGPYGCLDDLLRVGGIGEKTIESLRGIAGVDQNSMLTGQ